MLSNKIHSEHRHRSDLVRVDAEDQILVQEAVRKGKALESLPFAYLRRPHCDSSPSSLPRHFKECGGFAQQNLNRRGSAFNGKNSEIEFLSAYQTVQDVV